MLGINCTSKNIGLLYDSIKGYVLDFPVKAKQNRTKKRENLVHKRRKEEKQMTIKG